MKKWTKAKLKARCWALLNRPTTTIEVAAWNWLHNSELVDWDEKHIRIRVDIHQEGLIPKTLHALIHVAMEIAVKPLGDDSEEHMVKGWEAEIWKDISFSKWQLKRWRRAVNNRLERK